MARIRTIKPDFFKHEDLAELPAMTRLLFIGLWTQADRAGRLEDRPKRLKVEIFPYEEYDIESGLKDLETQGFIVRYDNSGRFIQISNFSKHQQPNIKEKESTIPAPCSDGTSITGKGKGMDIGNGEQEGGGSACAPAMPAAQFEFSDDGLPPITLSSNRPSYAPTLEDAAKYFEMIRAPDRMRKFFEHYESNGWRDAQGRPIAHWQSKANQWVTKDLEKEKTTAAKVSKAEQKEVQKNGAIKTADELLAERRARSQAINQNGHV